MVVFGIDIKGAVMHTPRKAELVSGRINSIEMSIVTKKSQMNYSDLDGKFT